MALVNESFADVQVADVGKTYTLVVNISNSETVAGVQALLTATSGKFNTTDEALPCERRKIICSSPHVKSLAPTDDERCDGAQTLRNQCCICFHKTTSCANAPEHTSQEERGSSRFHGSHRLITTT